MRYLVTGGLGVIGSRIAERLLEKGNKVSVVDSAEEVRNKWIASSLGGRLASLSCFRIETHPVQVEQLVRSADAVIHCAASTGIPYSVTDPSDDWERNVEGTRVLLDALRDYPRPTVVLSSVKPYAVNTGIEDMGRGLTEDTPLVPDEPYAASKAAQSMLAMAYARSYGLPVVTFRCSNLYGPAPCHGPRHGWLTWFCISAAIGRPIVVQGSGEQSRDMLHADDVFSACMAAFGAVDSIKGEVFNLGGGYSNRITVGLAADRLREATGVEVIRGEARKMDDMHVYANCSKFLKATGWRPMVGVVEGVKDVLSWALENKEDLKKIYEGV